MHTLCMMTVVLHIDPCCFFTLLIVSRYEIACAAQHSVHYFVGQSVWFQELSCRIANDNTHVHSDVRASTNAIVPVRLPMS